MPFAVQWCKNNAVLTGLGLTGDQAEQSGMPHAGGSMGKITGSFFVFLKSFRIVVSSAAISVMHDIARNASAIPAFSHHAGIVGGFRQHAF